MLLFIPISHASLPLDLCLKSLFVVDNENTFDFKRKEKYTWECLRENLETKPGGGGGLHSTPLHGAPALSRESGERLLLQ